MQVRDPDQAASPTRFPSSAADFVQACSHHPNRAEAIQAIAERSKAARADRGTGIDLKEVSLSKLDLSHFDFARACLNRASLFGTDLSSSVLEGASLICAGLERTRFAKANLRASYLHGFAAQVCDFSDADMSNIVDATGSLFHGCKLRHTALDGASLAGATFYQCDLAGASFRNALLQGATFNECHISGADFSGANLTQARFLKSAIEGASFDGASGEHVSFAALADARSLDLHGASFPGLSLLDCVLKDVDARRLHAPDAVLRNVGLERVDLSEAAMARSSWSSVRARDLKLEGAVLDQAAWRQVAVEGLSGARLSAENFHAVDCTLERAVLDGLKGRTLVMRDCALPKASLHRAYLYRAMITGDLPTRAVLREADMREAICVQAYIAADLSGADLEGINFAYARLNQAIFSCANLAGACLFEASMVKTDVSGASIKGWSAPFFADRVRGLSEAVCALDEKHRLPLETFLSRFSDALEGEANGST